MNAYVTNADLERRALAAYYRSSAGGTPDQPGDVRVQEVDGKEHVVLANVNGILAVYRVRAPGGQTMLKRLKRYPAELEG